MTYRHRTLSALVGAALVAGMTTAGTAVAAPSAQTAPGAVTASDPLQRLGCRVPVITTDKKGVSTFQMLGVRGGPFKGTLGRVTGGAVAATSAGIYGDGDLSRAPGGTVVAGPIIVDKSGVLRWRGYSLDGYASRVRKIESLPSARLGSAGGVRLLAADWEEIDGGAIIFLNRQGRMTVSETLDEGVSSPFGRSSMTFRKNYSDVRALSLSWHTGPRVYAVTNKNALVRVTPAAQGEKRIALHTKWRGMSRPIIPHHCQKARPGEIVFVAADGARRFHVYSEYNGKLRHLGVTRGQATGAVL